MLFSPVSRIRSNPWSFLYAFAKSKFLGSPTSNASKVGKVIFLLGGPGSGKSTHANLLSLREGYVHIDTGGLLREEIAKNTTESEVIKKAMESGQIGPIEIMMTLLMRALEQADSSKILLVNGFPRDMPRVTRWDAEMAKRIANNEFYAEVIGVIFLDTPEQTMINRIVNRGSSSGRVDDNLITGLRRIESFKAETLPVIDYYESKGLLIRVESNAEAEVVYPKMRALLEEKNLVPHLPGGISA